MANVWILQDIPYRRALQNAKLPISSQGVSVSYGTWKVMNSGVYFKSKLGTIFVDNFKICSIFLGN